MARFNLNLGSQTELSRAAAKASTPADAEAETLEALELQCDGWIWGWIGHELYIYNHDIDLFIYSSPPKKKRIAYSSMHPIE